MVIDLLPLLESEGIVVMVIDQLRYVEGARVVVVAIHSLHTPSPSFGKKGKHNSLMHLIPSLALNGLWILCLGSLSNTSPLFQPFLWTRGGWWSWSYTVFFLEALVLILGKGRGGHVHDGGETAQLS